jgi:lysozyme
MRSVTHASALAALSLVVVACAPSDSTTDDPDTTADEIRVCASGSTLKGPDVSYYNGEVDWAKVKAEGNAFAIARVSDGVNTVDSQFAANWAGMKAEGMVRGVYQYFRASQDPVAQADLLVSKVGAFGPGDLSPVVDVEDYDGKSGATVVKNLRTWIDRVKAKTGRDPIIYTSSGFWDALANTSQFAANTLWVANYTTLCPSMPTTWKKWAIWQYSDSGTSKGMGGAVDLNYFNGTMTDLLALAKGSPVATPACATDADCNQGATGTGKVCSDSGATAGTCVVGCHGDTDCPSGTTCDETLSPWACVSPGGPLPLGAACSTDAQCGGAGSGHVCGSSSQTCVVGCHGDTDCPSGQACDKSQPTWTCAVPAPTCPVLSFPSGIHIQTVTDAATTASYTNHLAAGQTAPTCFIDVTNMRDPVAGATYDLSVHVATNFQMAELVGTEVDQGYGNFVLASPEAVTALQQFRTLAAQAVTINSGFRSPKHQEDVCNSLCGDPLGCAGTCSNSSRHMWGDAFDLPMTFYTTHYENLACQAGFHYAYLESSTHLHIDMNPAYTSCVIQ